MQNDKSYKYDAFISYRHTEPDKAIAERLHKMLETYRVPRSIILKGGSKRVGRVFRDRDELPTSPNLADNIRDALLNSEHLVVICSRNTPASQWIATEIETFARFHGQDRILALLIEGEPAEAFPDALRTVRRNIVKEDGSIEDLVEEVEPLAADIRSDSLSGMKKKLRVEILRLLAPILGCRFDDLKQRHRERKIKKILTLAVCLSVFFLGFGSFSAWQAWQIKQQSDKVQEQSNLLKKQVQKTLEGQSLYMANTASRLLEEGDRRTAVMVAREALPEDLESPERPYVEEAEYALSQALGVYKYDNRFVPDLALKHDQNVNFTKLAPDGESAVTAAEDGLLYFWNTLDGTLLGTFNVGDPYFEKDNLYFPDSDTVVLISLYSSELICMDIRTQTVNWRYDGYSSHLTATPQGSGMAVVMDEAVCLVSREGDMPFKYSIKEYISDEGYVTCMGMDPSGRFLAVGTSAADALLFDCVNNSFLGRIAGTYPYIDRIAVSGDHLALVTSIIDETAIDIRYGMDIYSISDQRIIFTRNESGYIGQPTFDPLGKPILYFDEEGTLQVLDLTDFSTLCSFNNGDTITDYIVLDGIVLTSSRDGTIRFWVIDGMGGYEYAEFRITLPEGIRNIQLSSGVCAVSTDNSSKVVILRNLQGEGITRLSGHGNIVNEYDFSPDGKKLLTYGDSSNEILIWDWESKELINRLQTDSSIIFACYTDNGRRILVYGYGLEVVLYDSQSLEVISRMDSVNLCMLKQAFSPDRSLCLLHFGDTVWVCDASDLSVRAVISYTMPDRILFFNDNSRVILSSEYQATEVFDLGTGECLYGIEEDGAADVALSGDNTRMAYIGSDNSLYLLETQSFQSVKTIGGLDKAASRIIFDPEGKSLIVGMSDNSLSIYDIRAGSRTAVIESASEKLDDVFFSPDRSLYLTMGIYGEAIIRRSESNKMIARINDIIGVSPDFRTLLAAHGQDIVLMPLYTTQMLIDEANSQLNGRTLTQREREEYYILK